MRTGIPDHCRKSGPLRKPNGGTLPELLVATLLLVVVTTGLVGLVVVNNAQGMRLLNKVDGINAGREAFERIGRNVRIGRSVGDLYGAIPAPAAPIIGLQGVITGLEDLTGLNLGVLGLGNLENGTAIDSSASFPSDGDPAWGNGQIPNGGWPWPQLSEPYVLSPKCLIIQVPIFDANGYPIVQKGSVVNWESVDTYVYQVLPDPKNVGQYTIQVAGFPGVGSTANPSSKAQTILSGIVGPLNADGSIGVFHYVSRDVPGMLNTVADDDIANVSGVIMTVEIINDSNGPQPSTVSLKAEVYMRNNNQATVLGQ